MKNIYLISFNGGAGGDFLCSEISKDINFYSFQSSIDLKTNACDLLENPFSKWNLDVKPPDALWPTASISSEIDLYYNEKNLVLPTHYFDNVNQTMIPRLKGIRLYTKQFSPLFYLLLWIKRWINIQNFKGKEELDNIIFSRSFSKNADVNFFKSKIRDAIFENRRYIYRFELPALELLYDKAIHFVDGFFRRYNTHNNKGYEDKGWIPYNIDNLYLDPVNNVKEFSQLFNMEEPINPDSIAEHHSRNFQLIEKTFNESYETFISNNWRYKLKEWVRIQCPNAYSVDFKIL
jgi:hypothetical protein